MNDGFANRLLSRRLAAGKEDPDRVMEIIKEVGAETENDETVGQNIIAPIEIAGLDRFGESEIVIRARLKTKPGTQFGTGRVFRKLLKKAFDEQGIEIPFPHRTIYWGEKIEALNVEVKEVES